MAITITADSASFERLEYLLDHIDPNDISYDNWMRVVLAIFSETAGTAEGFAMIERWSRRRVGHRGKEYVASHWLLAFVTGRARGEKYDMDDDVKMVHLTHGEWPYLGAGNASSVPAEG